MKKAVLAAAIIVIIISSGIFLASRLGYLGKFGGVISPQPEPEPKPQLYMEVHSSLDTWYRDVDDRPVARYSLNIEIGNTGDAESDWANVDFTIEKDVFIIQSEDIPIGTLIEGDVTSISRQTELKDGEYEVRLELRTSSTVWDTFDDNFTIDFPRYGFGDYVRFYVTPNDPTVQTRMNIIGKNVNSLYGWVGDNVQYEYDSDVYGVSDYWQLPYETLSLKTGDCEDQAFLLCSLIRASGTSANNVFVALGEIDGGGHAWVILKTTSGWRVFEPTVEGIIERFLADIVEFLGLTDREYYSASNDLYFEEIDPSKNQPRVHQSFLEWCEDGLKLQGSRVTVKLNNVVSLKLEVTNPGYYVFIGFIKIEIRKDIVLGADVTFASQSYFITLDAGESQRLESTFIPDEITQDAWWKCRHYYYKVYTCFACIYDPTEASTRECLFVSAQ